MAFIIGGDGTLLRSAQDLSKADIPICGINRGRLGYLVDISPNHIEENLESIFSDDFTIDERISLEGIILRDGKEVSRNISFNDVVINSKDARMIELDAFVNDEMLYTINADGLVVSTPTGSTAYSLSLGGAILSPSSNNMIMKPIAAHTSLMGGLVIEKDVVISLKASSNEDLSISVDGFIDNLIEDFDQIDVEIDNENKVFFIRSENFENLYWNSLAQKLDLRKGDSING